MLVRAREFRQSAGVVDRGAPRSSAPPGVEEVEASALDLQFMSEALRLADSAAARGDVPVGALVVEDGRITGVGFNTREVQGDPSGHVVVAGCRLPDVLRRLARQLGVEARVHPVGPVDDLRPWLASADVLAHPTWYAPASPLVLEALAMSLPVITTSVDGAREVMGQRGGIVLEGPGEPEALAVAFGTLADGGLRAFTREDARYVAMRTRLATRLDQVLEPCRAVFERRGA